MASGLELPAGIDEGLELIRLEALEQEHFRRRTRFASAKQPRAQHTCGIESERIARGDQTEDVDEPAVSNRPCLAIDHHETALIAPLGRVSLKSVARLPLDQVHQFEAGGRKLFVPLIGFNILYRFGGTEGQASASFLVGRGNEEDEKLAPFRIDQGPKIFRGLSSRPHSIGMQNA